MNFFTWRNIDSIGKTRFSKSSYYFLILIPILVRLTEGLVSPFKFVFVGIEHEVNLTVPFTWHMFFWGALSISIGTFLYYIFCPSFIKKYRNFGEFKAKGEADIVLMNLGKKYLENDPDFTDIVKQRPYFNHDTMEDSDGPRLFSIITSQSENIGYNHGLKTIFHKLYDILNRKNIFLIRITTIFYIAGIVCFIMVLGQNIWFVIKHM
jgi:hypothetical protein